MYNTPMNKVSTLSFEKQEDFSRFGKTFQESLCRLILTDRTFADQIGEVLDFKFFELLQINGNKCYIMNKIRMFISKYQILTH